METKTRRAGRRRERGMTLIEGLVAMTLLMVISVGVLQLFSLSLAVNLGARTRTDLSLRCQRVVETIRLQLAVSRLGNATSACCPITNGSSFTIPRAAGGCYDFWGPAGAAVAEQGSFYTISYTIADDVVTVIGEANVEAAPADGQLAGAGAANITKVVRYAAHL